jgi:hypothetical protein
MAQSAAQSDESFALYPVFKVRNLGLAASGQKRASVDGLQESEHLLRTTEEKL